MRIGIYLENYIAGGVDTVLVNKINSWPNISDEIILFCNMSNDGLERIIKPRLKRKCVIVETNILSYHTIYHYFNGKPPFIIRAATTYLRHLFSVINFFRIKKTLSNYNLDNLFIHNGGYPGALSAIVAVGAARAIGINGIYSVIHNLPAKYMYREYFFDLIYDILLNKSSVIICVSNKSADILKKFRRILKPICVIPNGIIPIDIVNKSQIDAQRKDNGIDILMLGSFEARKGHKILIEAISILQKKESISNLHIHIVGTGTEAERQNLLDQIDNLKLSNYFSFHGFVDNIHDLLTNMNILVFPSIKAESFPMTILEAMNSGLAIVASDVGGVREMLDETGIIVTPSDTDELVEALIQLITQPLLMHSLGKDAMKRFYNNYTADKMAMHYRNTMN